MQGWRQRRPAGSRPSPSLVRVQRRGTASRRTPPACSSAGTRRSRRHRATSPASCTCSLPGRRARRRLPVVRGGHGVFPPSATFRMTATPRSRAPIRDAATAASSAFSEPAVRYLGRSPAGSARSGLRCGVAGFVPAGTSAISFDISHDKKAPGQPAAEWKHCARSSSLRILPSRLVLELPTRSGRGRSD